MNKSTSLSDVFCGLKNPKSHHTHFWVSFIGCIGIVYGDIGTSPLYAFREAIGKISQTGLNTAEVYGILSLIVWSLIIIVAIKYMLFLMRANDKGEGGMFVLMNLVEKSFKTQKNKKIIMGVGVIGASLFYADAAITPAISVMSAVEGLKQVTPIFEHFTLALSIIILCFLFYFQKFGTNKVSIFFGPMMVLWFFVIGFIGIFPILNHPNILLSFNPVYGFNFLFDHGIISLVVLGAIFLTVTGAEALYADMGHFGIKPIQKAWLFFVFPALVINYMGQGALILEKPEAIENPFFMMVPDWGLLPLVGLATCATIIASQAVITGAFSLTRQAIQLGFLPRMEIQHTSENNIGQIYMPKLNYLLLYAVLFFCILFQNSSALASAYGMAVSGTMVITTILAFFVIYKIWKKSLLVTLLIIAPILCIEISFLVANSFKLFEGGIIPVLFGLYLSLLMAVWISGSQYLAKKTKRFSTSLENFCKNIDKKTLAVAKGTAIFFTPDHQTTPESLVKNIQYNQIIHEKNIIITLITSSSPKVENSNKLHIEIISPQITRIIIYFGFMETPDVPKALLLAKHKNLEIDLEHATYFLTRRKIISDPHHGLPAWQDKLYLGLRHFAIGEHDFLNLPRARVVELGVQVTI